MDNFKNRWEPKTSSTDVNNEVILEVARKLPSELHCKCQYIGAQLHMHAHIYPYIYICMSSVMPLVASKSDFVQSVLDHGRIRSIFIQFRNTLNSSWVFVVKLNKLNEKKKPQKFKMVHLVKDMVSMSKQMLFN